MSSYLKYLIIVTLFLHKSIGAQENSSFKISSNYTQGIILPEFGLLDSINEGPYQGAELSIFSTSKVNNHWQQLYNYPKYGFSLFYTSFGEDDVLGYAIGGDYFFNVNLVAKQRFTLYNRTGFGFSYISQNYNELSNPINESIGSKANVRFNLRLGARMYCSKKLALNLGVGLDHFSNANTKYPNKGLNAINGYVGLTYRLSDEIEEYAEFEIPVHERKLKSSFTFYLGMNHTKWPNNTYYAVPTLSYDLNHTTGRVVHLRVGVQVLYDGAIKPRYGVLDDFETVNSMMAGVHLGQSINYNKFSFTLYEGLWLYTYEELNKKEIYNRVVFGWRVTEKVGINVFGISYLNDLDYVGAGITYNFSK
jgi:hypothetical protein